MCAQPPRSTPHGFHAENDAENAENVGFAALRWRMPPGAWRVLTATRVWQWRSCSDTTRLKWSERTARASSWRWYGNSTDLLETVRLNTQTI